jgi:hypothetical protein
MLAYVFWHSPSPAADLRIYQQRLISFHKALSQHSPDGFRASHVFRTESAPWIAGGKTAYEDWYLVESFAAIGALNDAAVSGARKAPHDLIASLAASGAAGLYRLKTGQLESMRSARHATWFSKPSGTYDEFFQQLRPITDAPDTNLWLRQMVLSAAPEFCLRTPEKPHLPSGIPILHCPIEGIYAS